MSTSLKTFINGVHSQWGPLSSELIETCSMNLVMLTKAPPSDAWLRELRSDMPEYRELYRDPADFLLLAHAERLGQYRAPHDHGRGWVVYAVQDGEIEMGTYLRAQNVDGAARLVKRGSTIMRPGDVQAFLPGDIHDTRCLSDSALYYRFTDRDLRKEEEARLITRYAA